MKYGFGKYGELDPGDVLDVSPIFQQAMDNFLWPTKIYSVARKQNVTAPLFNLWCDWWAHNLSIWPPMHGLLPWMNNRPLWWAGVIEESRPAFAKGPETVPPPATAPVPWDTWLTKVPKVQRHSAGDERAFGGYMESVWRQTWDAMLGEDCKKPKKKAPLRGMKFFLIVQVLRCGLYTGMTAPHRASKVKEGRALRRVTWSEARDAAALFLAWSALAYKGKAGSARDSTLAEVNRDAETWAADPGVIDRADLDASTHGLAGYRKVLRINLPPSELQMISCLAAEYENISRRGLGDWMKKQEIAWWFGK